MQFSLTEKDLVLLVQKHVNSLIAVREGAEIAVILVGSPAGSMSATVSIVERAVAKHVVPVVDTKPVTPPWVETPVAVAPVVAVAAPAVVAEPVVEAPVATVVSAEDRLTAKFGPGPGATPPVIEECVDPARLATTPVVSLFNKAKIPSTPAEARAAMEAEVAAEEAAAVVEDTVAEVTPEVPAAAVVAAEEVRKPTSLFKNLRKPVNA